DGLARLYARYAERLPEGPVRARATQIAHTVAVLLQQTDLSVWATVFSPTVEFVDARTVGMGRVRGVTAVVRGMRALFDLHEGTKFRVDAVLGLDADELLVRWTHLGNLRSSGGAFERPLCVLFRFAADGRLAYWEQFEGDHPGEALAGFDALTTALPPPSLHLERDARAGDRQSSAAASFVESAGAKLENAATRLARQVDSPFGW